MFVWHDGYFKSGLRQYIFVYITFRPPRASFTQTLAMVSDPSLEARLDSNPGWQEMFHAHIITT